MSNINRSILDIPFVKNKKYVTRIEIESVEFEIILRPSWDLICKEHYEEKKTKEATHAMEAI